MFNVPGGAGGLVDGPTDHGPRHIAILLYLRAADLHRLVVGLALVLDHANLPEILLALLLLLGLVVGDVGGVAPPVEAVVALHDVIVLDLLHHQHLVKAPLPVRAAPCGRDLREARRSLYRSLTLVPAGKILRGVMIPVTVMVVLVIRVEGECVHKRLPVSLLGRF